MLISLRQEQNAFVLYRDTCALETPAHFPLAVPTKALAEALVQEFTSQGEKPDLRKMPYTQIVLTAIDVTALRAADIVNDLMRFGETELVCQRAADPPELVSEQNKVWQPYLDWCKECFGAKLETGSGIIPFAQDKEALAALRAAIEKYDAFCLAGLSHAAGVLGSLVLALALRHGRANATSAFEAAELDQLWQNRKWGEDPVLQARHAEIKRDVAVCENWFRFLRL